MTGDVDLTRALSFGAAAEEYDRVRPSYPAELIDDLAALHPRTVLDVGAGTGKATELLAARGLDVLAVEADVRMAAIVRRKGLRVEVSPFQTWDTRGRSYDMITAAQAWHWMPQPESAERAHELLSRGGRLAAFWNLDVLDERTRAALEPVYRRLAPEIADDNVNGERPQEQLAKAAHADPLRAAGFAPIEVRAYTWSMRYSTAEWVACVATHSDHSTLTPVARGPLLREVAAVIDGIGGRVRSDFTTVLILATRI